jgi:hypothetical protein
MNKYSLSPFPDRELTQQLEQCEPYFQGDDFGRFLEAQKRFDNTVHVVDEKQGIDRQVNHYFLKQTLKQIPEYMQSVNQSRLSYEQGLELLMHMLNGDKYNFSNKKSDMLILTKALNDSHEDKSLPRSINKIKKLMSAGVGGSGMGGTIYSFFITARLGVPVSEASSIIVPAAEGSYVIGPFNEALKSMLPAKPNPKLVVEAFTILNGDGRNYWNAGYYRQFEQFMTFVAPGNGISVDNMLAMFASASKSPSKRKELECAAEKKEAQKEGKERYFLPFDGKLECLAQPYVAKRSWNEGLKDLTKLATASLHDWEEIGEGMFVFDPKDQLWYSLGGKLETPSIEEVLSGRAERVRHNFLSYDISSLSETPLLFHIHPEALECFVRPSRDSLVYPHLQYSITKFLTATPSRADYKVVAQLIKNAKSKVTTRSFIAHALGITEFVYPHDIKAIGEMGEKARDLRDQPLLNPKSHWTSLDEAPFVEALIQDLNTKLPEGFAINLNPLN